MVLLMRLYKLSIARSIENRELMTESLVKDLGLRNRIVAIKLSGYSRALISLTSGAVNPELKSWLTQGPTA